MRPCVLVLLLVAGAACAKRPSPVPAPPEPGFEGAMPVAFGACSGGEEQGADQPASGGSGTSTGTGDITAGVDAERYGGLLGTEAGAQDGGFGYGRTGVGPSNGGPNWGALGTGRYGTIQRGRAGYGTGIGRSGSDRGASSVPMVVIGQPTAVGGLDKEIVRRYLKRTLIKIQNCYERELVTKPGLTGTLAAKLFIAPSGVVASSSASGVDAKVASCVAEVLKAIEFPEPKGGGGVQVSCPFTFRPTASTPGPPPPAPAVVQPSRVGSANPLRAVASELTACFRQHPKHFGVGVVELHYDATGNVTSARTHGIDDDRTRSCVTDAVKRVKRSDASVTTQRCSVAFGTMPATDSPPSPIP